MTYEEAMKAATRGYKVAPMGSHGYYVYKPPEMGYRRVTICKFGNWWDEDFHPTPIDKLRVWEIYDKSLLKMVKDFFKQALGKKKMQLSSNPS